MATKTPSKGKKAVAKDGGAKKGAKPSDSVRTLLGKHLSRDLSATEAPVEAQ